MPARRRALSLWQKEGPIQRPAAPDASRVDLRDLAARAHDVIYRYRLHPSRGFEYVSPAATRITGYTPEEHYADPDLGFKLVHPDDRPLLADVAEHGGAPDPLVIRWKRKDGRTIWTEQLNTGVYDESGTLVAVEGIARKIADPTRTPGETVRLVGDIHLQLLQHRAYVAGHPVRLTPSEFRLLWLLTSHPDEIVSRDELMRELWQSSHTGSGHACEVHISTLRHKIEPEPRFPQRIVTVRGRGYKFVATHPTYQGLQ